ncbi:MAG: hypothetical protein R3E04_11230 [Sphingobium sp.]
MTQNTPIMERVDIDLAEGEFDTSSPMTRKSCFKRQTLEIFSGRLSAVSDYEEINSNDDAPQQGISASHSLQFSFLKYLECRLSKMAGNKYASY